ncbi:hypothetical protein HJC23_002129 [Cyclotella cryptica]|uniref:Uncharacterized protein n=1 Tax=Cyclotella cryptica TaxID=29204 RepID=A0ABD3Q1P2_9STRA
MAEVNLVPIPDYEVLDKLLILWDTNATECIDPKNMESVLSENATNKVLLFFGDAVLHEMQIGVIIDDMFKVQNFGKDEDTVVYADAVVYGDALFKVAVHPSTIEFAWGFNTARYGTAQ